MMIKFKNIILAFFLVLIMYVFINGILLLPMFKDKQRARVWVDTSLTILLATVGIILCLSGHLTNFALIIITCLIVVPLQNLITQAPFFRKHPIYDWCLTFIIAIGTLALWWNFQ